MIDFFAYLVLAGIVLVLGAVLLTAALLVLGLIAAVIIGIYNVAASLFE